MRCNRVFDLTLLLILVMYGCKSSSTPIRVGGYEQEADSSAPAEETVAGRLTECPSWAKEAVPDWVRPYLGRFGLPDPYPRQEAPIGVGTRGIDFWQANHFVAYAPETADFLYTKYTPLTVSYRLGSLAVGEEIVKRYTAGIATPKAKALTLLTRAMPELIRHPAIPPLGPKCPTDRAMDEEELLASGKGYCNEQARVFVRLCQIAGIPARMVFLFYHDIPSGHVIAEFYADGRWIMADTSWFCVFPGADGRLMSAAECHRDSATKRRVGEAYVRRGRELLDLSDEELVGGHFASLPQEERKARIARKAESVRRELTEQQPERVGERLWAFGLLNYPLPQ